MEAKKYFILFLLLTAHLSVFCQSSYITKYKPLADSLSKEYGIPVKVILGIAVVESSSGTSRNARLLNNHFGVVGKNNLMKTKGIKTAYKQYPSAKDSYIYFVKMISRKKYYNTLKGDTSCSKWVHIMSLHGYSVKPESWRRVILSTIKKIKI